MCFIADGTATDYAYDGEDRLLRITDHGGNATVMTYDDGGRLTKKTLPDGGEITYTYDACGNLLTETDPLGNVVAKTYDNMGNVLTVTDPAGNVTSYQYDARGRVSRVTNAMGGVTTYTYSAAGDLLSETTSSDSETAPFVHTKTYTYDAFGNRVTATDAKGSTTTYTYDANNNLVKVKDAENCETNYTYDNRNLLMRVTDAEEKVTLYVYDAKGRQIQTTDARGKTFSTQRDGNGNVIKVIAPYNKVLTETTYDKMNRPLTVKDGVGNTTTYTYTYHGKVETVTDPLNQVKEFAYNSRGMNTAVTDAADGTSTNTYDLSGNVTRLQGPLGGGTNYEYTYGRLWRETTVSGGYVTYAYNALNLPSSVTNARGNVTTMTYDAKGRLTGKTSPEETLSYSYDANDNLLNISNGEDAIIREYDSLNRLTRRTDTNGNTVAYTYDDCGHITSITYPDETTVTYGYDNNYNLTSVTDWANRTTEYEYDNNNRLTEVTKPNGCVTTTVYDDAGRVTSTVERSGVGAIVVGYEYTYDANSRVIEEKVLAKSIKLCYTYDVLNRVTKRTKKNLSDDTVLSEETFTYDAAGNVTNANGETAQYSLNNRIMVFNGSGVGCDLDGNLTSLHFDSGWMDLTYDSKNRLTSAGGHTYTYDAEDVRIRNLCGDVDTTYAYDTNGKLSRLLMKTTNGVTTKYVYGIGLIGEQTGNSFRYYHFDSRGSTVALTGGTGIVTDTFEYDTYGKVTAHTGNNEVIFGYNGRDGVVTDANGLLYMRARYYSPEMRRFVNADILPGGISEAITLNRYAYANGNPVSFVDPFGLEALLIRSPYVTAAQERLKAKKREKKKRAEEFIRKVSEATGFDEVIDFLQDAHSQRIESYESAKKRNNVKTSFFLTSYLDEGLYSFFYWHTYLHFEGREALNGEHPTYSEVKSDPDWVLLTPEDSKYHDNGQGKPEEKYVHRDGREAVFDGNTHEPIIDPDYIATFNYGAYWPFYGISSVRDVAEYPYRAIGHGVLDLAPYYLTLNSNTREQYEDKVVALKNNIIEYSKNPMALGEDIFSYFVDQLDHFVSKLG